MESYFDAKMRLFDEVVDENGCAVIWADDVWSDQVIARARKRDLRMITVGEKGKGVQLLSREATQLGQTLELRIQGDVYKVKLPLIGAYQAANALVAAGVVMASGGDVESLLSHLARLQPVRGRLERAVITKSGAPVYVDYAHTPDALEQALKAACEHTDGKLWCVFGCGGGRDTGKRSEMGRIAATLADRVVLTTDNPREEAPESILHDIQQGLAGRPATIIADRAEAIAHALKNAASDDVVLIAGKGHETYQEIMGVRYPFNDVEQVRLALNTRSPA